MQQKLISLNEYFIQNNSGGDLQNPDVFSYFEKGSKVCLSAPHTTGTFVNKHLKCADLYTGAITEYIAETCHFSYIVRNKFVPRKVLINDFILDNKLENHFFLDIHGMKDGNGFDLAVGTGFMPPEKYAKQLEYIDKLAQKYNLVYVVNNANYVGCAGLTGRLQQATGKANVLQLEWSKCHRDIFNEFAKVKNITVPFISELAALINADN